MADVTIPNLPSAPTPLSSSDLFIVNSSSTGQTCKCSWNDIFFTGKTYSVTPVLATGLTSTAAPSTATISFWSGPLAYLQISYPATDITNNTSSPVNLTLSLPYYITGPQATAGITCSDISKLTNTENVEMIFNQVFWSFAASGSPSNNTTMYLRTFDTRYGLRYRNIAIAANSTTRFTALSLNALVRVQGVIS